VGLQGPRGPGGGDPGARGPRGGRGLSEAASDGLRGARAPRPRTSTTQISNVQIFSSKRALTQKRQSLLNLTSEQHVTLQRKTEVSTHQTLQLHTEQAISVRREVTQKRVALLNLNSEQSFTLVTSGTRRLREQLEALVARVEELEKTRP